LRKTGAILKIVCISVFLTPVFCSVYAAKPLLKNSTEIRAFCGSASKPALEELTGIFEEKTGIRVVLYFSGSGTALSQMKLSGKGDIYIPGSPDYMAEAADAGIIDKRTTRTIAYLIPALLVRGGNPKNIEKLEDLTEPGLRVAIANPDSVVIGKYAVEILEKSGLLGAIGKNIVTFTESASKAASLLPLNAVDAVIGWRVFGIFNSDIDLVLLPPDQIPRISYIPAAVSSTCLNPDAAGAFIEFLTGDEGREVFNRWGYITTRESALKFSPEAEIGGVYRIQEQLTPLQGQVK
jgi:molybdate transport system substrate-binding protein